MNVGTLKQLLEAYDDDADVMIAHQPSWPLAEVVANVTTLEDAEIEDVQRVWIVAGGPADDVSPYAPSAVFA